MPEPRPLNELTHAIIGAAIAVHGAFGPGLFETTYIAPFVWELEDRGLKSATRVGLDLTYRGRCLRNAYNIDVLVENLIVVEIKAVERLLPVHLAQVITYVRLARKPAGLLINFNEKRLVDGVRRVLNDRHPASELSGKADQRSGESISDEC